MDKSLTNLQFLLNTYSVDELKAQKNHGPKTTLAIHWMAW